MDDGTLDNTLKTSCGLHFACGILRNNAIKLICNMDLKQRFEFGNIHMTGLQHLYRIRIICHCKQ